MSSSSPLSSCSSSSIASAVAEENEMNEREEEGPLVAPRSKTSVADITVSRERVVLFISSTQESKALATGFTHEEMVRNTWGRPLQETPCVSVEGGSVEIYHTRRQFKGEEEPHCEKGCTFFDCMHVLWRAFAGPPEPPPSGQSQLCTILKINLNSREPEARLETFRNALDHYSEQHILGAAKINVAVPYDIGYESDDKRSKPFRNALLEHPFAENAFICFYRKNPYY